MSGTRFGYLLFPLLVIGCTTLLTATARFHYEHPAGEQFAVSPDGVIIRQPDAAGTAVAEAVTNEATYDFGLMNPLTMGQHSFVVRNAGNAPLTLQAGPTSCKCTLGSVSDKPIPPGQQGEVTVQWNTGRDKPFYAHTASVTTNDPRRKVIEFSVRGKVRVQLALTLRKRSLSESVRIQRPSNDCLSIPRSGTR